jgi:hypothetical protein
MEIPRTFIVGELSNPTDDELAEFTSRGIGVEIVPTAGHDMAIENPRGVAEAIAGAIAVRPDEPPKRAATVGDRPGERRNQGRRIAPSDADPTSAA